MIDLLMQAIVYVVLAIVGAAICIVRIAMYPTLRRYGVDPNSGGWRQASSWSWVVEYRKVCVEHGLPLRYWNLVRLGRTSVGALTTAWLVLFIVQIWRDLAR